MSKYTAFRCPEDLLEAAKAKAASQHRSVSNYIITLIAADVAGENLYTLAQARKSLGLPAIRKSKAAR